MIPVPFPHLLSEKNFSAASPYKIELSAPGEEGASFLEGIAQHNQRDECGLHRSRGQ